MALALCSWADTCPALSGWKELVVLEFSRGELLLATCMVSLLMKPSIWSLYLLAQTLNIGRHVASVGTRPGACFRRIVLQGQTARPTPANSMPPSFVISGEPHSIITRHQDSLSYAGPHSWPTRATWHVARPQTRATPSRSQTKQIEPDTQKTRIDSLPFSFGVAPHQNRGHKDPPGRNPDHPDTRRVWRDFRSDHVLLPGSHSTPLHSTPLRRLLSQERKS